MRWIVLETAILGRIMRRRHHDAIRQPHFSASIEIEDGTRDRGSRRVRALGSDAYVNVVGCQHFHRGGERGLGKRMRIDAQKERPVDSFIFAIVTDSLRDRQDVPLVERAIQRCTRCPEVPNVTLCSGIFGSGRSAK